MRSNQAFCEKGGKAGKKSGEDTAEKQKGQIGKNTGSPGEQESCQKLPHIMGKTAEGTCEKGKAASGQAIHQIHEKQGKNATGKTVQEADCLTE